MTERHANPEDFDLYALGALDGEDKLTFEAHVRACAVCRQQLAEARGRASRLGLAAAPAAPSPELKSALMQQVRAENPARKEQAMPDANSQAQSHPNPASPKAPRKKSWGLRFSLAFAAAAIVLAFGTNWLWKQNRQHQRDIAQLQAQLNSTQRQASQDAATLRDFSAVVGAPDTVHVTLQQQAGGPPGQAHVLYNARLGMAVYSGEISPPPSGWSYQLWLMPAKGAPVNGGVLAANPQNGAVVVHLEQGLAAQAFAVTLEPEGGKPQPTGPKVLVGTVSS